MNGSYRRILRADASAEELLVGDGWKTVEIEPDAVEVNGNGTNSLPRTGYGGNDHHDGIGPTVELDLGIGGHGNKYGNGHAPGRKPGAAAVGFRLGAVHGRGARPA